MEKSRLTDQPFPWDRLSSIKLYAQQIREKIEHADSNSIGATWGDVLSLCVQIENV